MTLDNLVGKGLNRITPDPSAIARLLEAAKGSLANAMLQGMNDEGKFDMAYKAIMQLANAALQANGYRTLTSTPGHHQTMIQSLTLTIGLESGAMVVLDRLRRQRNLIDYSGDRVSTDFAAEAIDHALALQDKVLRWLVDNKPELVMDK